MLSYQNNILWDEVGSTDTQSRIPLAVWIESHGIKFTLHI